MSDGDFESKYGFAKPAKNAAVVTHCLKGMRAMKAAEALKEAGFDNVKAYAGSFEDWQANKGPVESN